MKKLFAATVVAMSLVGCASVPMADSSQDASAKAFKAPEGKAGVYVYRNESMGAAAKMDVAVDGKPLGQTVAKSFLYTEVTPGKHTITSAAENTDSLDIDAKEGTLVYIWEEVKMGVLSARSKLHVVSDAEGQKGVQESKLVATPAK